MKTLFRIGLLAIALAVIVGANWSAWRGTYSASVAAEAAADPAWEAFAGITCAPSGNSFPADLVTREGSQLTLTGVVFAPPQLVTAGHLDGALLAPPSRFSCCGLTCDTRPQLLVFVEPARGTPAPDGRRLCTVSGTLRLHRDGSGWTATSLEAATLLWLADPAK